ncbi:SasC/Mrp/FmtB intercellular aggregation protein [Staphylococcus sp. AtDRG32]|uniref:SasC/FmtB family protein n=1 Tax=Staphylococcus sp. AtDRG32 TaxID=1938892 RepID=UPI001063DCF5|nr:SasC/FmtB family protein [Staphylococcus sp. AtDRG32]TDW08926.1 SasC/Mrp/FmtB intercellular aggregation protein [Staphylococcus sp. AtDRG32]
MNLFKKQKFSIRKFSVGTFSTLIATVVFLSHPGHAATHDAETNTSAPQTNESATINKQNTNIEQPHSETTSTNISNSNENNRNNESNTSSEHSINREREEGTVNNVINSTENNTNHNEKVTTNDVVSNENNHETTNVNQPHRRGKRSVDNIPSTTNTDPMAVNEQNTGQIINGTFTDNSQGATIPTKNLESAMNEANTVPGWHVNSNDQTIIPLIWGPKSLPAYNPYIFDKTNNKIGVVLSKYNGNFNLVPGIADPTVGSIYQDVDVTPGSEIQLHYISSSMNNIWGVNGARVYIYDANNPSTLLYKGTPDILQNPIGNFVGVFQVPETVSRLRLRFESALNRSTDSTNGHRLLTGPNNFGGGVLADVTINSGAYLTATVNNTHYFAQSGSINADRVYQEIGFRIENRGHSSSNKTEYTIVLPEDVTYVSTKNATGKFNAATKELTVKIDRLDAGASKNISIGLSLPTDRPIEKEFLGHLTYVTDGINMNRLSDSKDFGRNNGDHYTRYGVHNEFVSVDSGMRQGDIVLDKQTITVKMYKQHLRDKVTEIEDDLANLDQNDNSPEVWEAMQMVLRKAKEVLAETDEMPISELKDQATINSIDLNLDKAHAKLSLDKVARTKRALFMGNDTATIEEKNAVIEQVNQALQSSYTTVDQSMTSNDVATNKDTGINEITMIDLTPTVKQAAIDELTERANAKKVEFDNNPDATVEEKEAAKATIDNLVSEATTNIMNETTNNGVAQQKTSSIDSVNAATITPTVRSNARTAIDNIASARKVEIDKDNNATLEEKNAAKTEIDNLVARAKADINSLNHNNEIEILKENKVNEISQVVAHPVKKNAAAQAIDQAAIAKKQEIDLIEDATIEEKEVAKAKVDKIVTEAKNNINQATTNSSVDDAQNEGITAINAVIPEVVKKSDARDTIDEVARIKKAAIDQTPDATVEEKEAAIAKIDQEVTKAKELIHQALKNENVDTAKTNGTNFINAIQPEITKKMKARETIDEVARAKKEAIDRTLDATTEEKEAAKAKVDQAVTEAKAHINEAINNSGVDEAKTNGTTTINAIQPEVIKKSEARQAIDAAARAKKEAIDQTPDATTEEKEAAKAKVDQAVTEAKGHINEAINNSGVNEAKTNGTTTINAIQPEVIKKSESRQAIDDIARAKKEAIDQTPGATTEEKEAAKAKVDQAVTEAKGHINEAINNSGVDEAKTNGTTTINAIQPEVIKKSEARQAIDDAARVKKEAIDQTPDATTEEKEAAKAKVDQAVTEAKAHINEAINNSGVDETKTNGTTTINAIQPEVIKKSEARQAIDDVARAKKEAIDQTPDATTEEKEAAKAKVDQAVTEAKAHINETITNSDVDEAKTNGTTTINAIQPDVLKKSEARQAIDNEVINKKTEIDNNVDATIEEKEAAKSKVDEAAVEAKNNINHTEINQAVDKAKEDGVTTVSHIQPNIVKKIAAKTAIDEVARIKKEAIDQTLGATTEEKEAAKSKVDEAATEARNNINRALSNNDVDQVVHNSTASINNIQPDIVKKEQAKRGIDTQAKIKKAIIDQISDATTEEKEAAKSKVDEEVTKAKHSIDQAVTNSDVDQAKDRGNVAINNIQPEVVKKETAKTSIDQIALTRKNIIDQTPDATTEEKEAAKSKVDEEVTKAKRNINQAVTNNDVNQVEHNSTIAINNIQPNIIKKIAAKTLIDQVARAKKNNIDQTSNATIEEKEAAKQKVDEEVTKAKHSIDQAIANSDVDQAKDRGNVALNNIQPEVVKKETAKNAIDQIALTRKAIIDQTPDATEEEKEAAKSKIDEEVIKAKHGIDQAKTNNDVDQVEQNSTTMINNIQPTVVKKSEARQAIDDLAKLKKATIDLTQEATEEEKEAAKSKVDQALTEAKTHINEAENDEGVDEAKTKGINVINTIQLEIIKKVEAKHEIDQSAIAKKKIIDQTPDATEEEKEVAKQKVDEEATKAKDNIDQASTNDAVDQAKTTGNTEINNIQPEVVKKSLARQAIDEVAKVKKEKINQMLDATEEEKEAAKQKVDEEVIKAKNNINQATTNDGVNNAKTTGKNTIENIQPEVVKKAEARKAIDEAATLRKNLIDQDNSTTKEEKDIAKQKIDDEVNKAKRNVDQSINNSNVDHAQINGISAINNINAVALKKTQAKKSIDDEVTAKKAEIDSNHEATNEEKEMTKRKVDEAATKAKHNVDQSTTNDTVDQSTQIGISIISNIQPETIQKSLARQAIDDEATIKKAEIENNHNATKEEKDVARQKVDEEVIKAKNNIAQSTTNSDVEIAKESGKHAIDEIQPEIVKKSVAKQTIDELAKQKKAEIDQTPNATKEEKDAAKQKVEEAVMRAKKLLEGANTNSDVDQTTEQGKQSINSIQVEVIKKADALSKLEVELQKLKDKVSSDQTFTIDEKLFIKQKLDGSYKKAEEKVNQAQTNKQVDNIKIHYLQEFNKIVLIDKVKLKAKSQIFDVANKRKAYIKGLTNISEYNRNKAYKQIDVYVMKALNKLAENVTTNDINELTRVTINEIEHVNVKQFENNFGLVNDNKVTFNNFNNKFNVNNNHSKLNTLPYTGENENSLLSLAEFTLLSGLLLLLKRRKKEDK